MAIELKNIFYSYEKTADRAARVVLDGIDLTLSREDFTAVIGPTGSGKSTLVQHLNLLLRAVSGDILYDGESIYAEDYDRKGLRSKVGLVFQYPEYQLFETDILSDVCFGPRNLGLPEEEVRERAVKALEAVGFSDDDHTRSPFDLSGGQKRRVAIAGILAMQPEFLILDEPAAGLDPQGRREMLDLVRGLHDSRGTGIVLVSHSMDDVAGYADRIVALYGGRVVMDGTPREIFSQRDKLEEIGLSVPQATQVADELRKAGMDIPKGLITVDEVAEAILGYMKSHGGSAGRNRQC
ncbi:MAG: energy-coupling factor transporter ATPase [Lachnospiraceae bacterium]|nr:energy-coupling factor transporter ATPase [Lachnospiraceae bacterium]